MARKRDEDYDLRRQQIILGALHVFAEKGFEEASNKEIAAASEIGSPGLIYHYFQDKEDLLRAVLTHKLPLLQLAEKPEEIMKLPLPEALMYFGGIFFKQINDPDTVAFMKLMFGEAIRRPQSAKVVFENGPLRGLQVLAKYFEIQIELGTLRRADPMLMARQFMSPIMAYFLTREVFQQPQPLECEAFLELTVSIFLTGMSQKDGEYDAPF
jgi:AcrR family transcriptional regulator